MSNILNKVLNNKATKEEIDNYLKKCSSDEFDMVKGWIGNDLFNDRYKIAERKRKLKKINSNI